MAETAHSALTGANIHAPFPYIQDADPGAVGAGKFWLDTNSGPPLKLYRRNSGDTDWDEVGGGATLTVQEVDGTPSDTAVTVIRVTNGKLTDNGAGDVTLDLSGSVTGGLTLITETTLGVAAASVDFTSIAGTYKNLRLAWAARGDTTAQAIRVRLNNDSGSNYDTIAITNATIAGESAQTSGRIGTTDGTGNPAGVFSQGQAVIVGYAGTAFNKQVMSEEAVFFADGGNTGGNFRGNWGVRWRSSAAVTRVTIFPASGNFAADSVFQLWGES